MAKTKAKFVCQNCGTSYAKWAGRCEQCGEWNTLLEQEVPTEAEAKSALATEPQVDIPEHKIIGEAFDCYVMVEIENSMLFIDKHAAHERIIFEDLKKSRAYDGRIASQALMLPITVILQSDELASAAEFKEELLAIGFEFNLNERSVDIIAIPDAISAQDAEGLFVSMLGELSDGVGTPENTEAIRREKALYQIACKAAIKGGRIYDKSIVEWLVKRILAIPDITVCPHGRPVAYKLTKRELDRQFDRIK
jgi:DNA mismatch repair protein MutL